MVMNKQLVLLIAVQIVLQQIWLPPWAVAVSRPDLPAPEVKKLPLAREQSISTYVPSASAPGNGLAVNLVFPEKPRYKEGAPVAVLVPAHRSGITFSMHAAQAGFLEVRMSFPGTGTKGFQSGGIADNFGPASQAALKDVIMFGAGKVRDYKGRTISELVPIPVDTSNVGVVGWSTGGNIVLVTLAKFAEDLPFVSWLAFYESSVGSMLYPPNLGSDEDLLLNRRYRPGSAATGQILVDYRRLAYAPDVMRHPGRAKRRGEPEIKGVLYFDENLNKTWDESLEFAFNYAVDIGLEKQIYPPDVTRAILRLKLFQLEDKTKDGKFAGKGAALGGGSQIKKTEGDDDDTEPGSAPNKSGKAGNASKAGGLSGLFGFGRGKKIKTNETMTENVSDDKESRLNDKQGMGKGAPAAARLKKFGTVWPETLAQLKTSEAYFRERDGSLYFKQIAESYPNILIMLFGSKLDHMQRQPDHPNIALLYNGLLANKVNWVKLNPEPIYLSTMFDMHVDNFNRNEPNKEISAESIVDHLLPEGFVPDYAMMTATIAELADRARTGNLESPLDEALVDYKAPLATASKKETGKDSQDRSQDSGGSK